ncbi:hypothetical protein [Sinorhizobium sp. BG8]|uniref:hypothetical protein n=1 Tax=Sinorhizobium sp. BG8 TaxID=2613773 RepID=UPI00193E3E84|nr:hypothetical protein [Sinorhizobium sp. BG8]QRM57414.1 hypothetical protein F3Y30_23250 [Sinorhizobium sp. BG8]
MAPELDERGDDVAASHDADRKTYSAVETRQGLLGRPVFIVLAAAMALVLVAWAGAEIWGESTDTDQTTQSEQTSPEQTGSIDNGAPAGGATHSTPQTSPMEGGSTLDTGTGGQGQ